MLNLLTVKKQTLNGKWDQFYHVQHQFILFLIKLKQYTRGPYKFNYVPYYLYLKLNWKANDYTSESAKQRKQHSRENSLSYAVLFSHHKIYFFKNTPRDDNGAINYKTFMM